MAVTRQRNLRHSGINAAWYLRVVLFASVTAVVPCLRALAANPIFAEEYCNLSGFTKPIRQTIVILDQRLVVANPEGGIAPENQRWMKDIHSLFDPVAPGRVATFLPRERVSLYVAPSSGTQPKLLFTGCVPRFSQEEVASIERQRGWGRRLVDYAWAGGPTAAATAYAKRFFQTKLANQLWDIRPPAKDEELGFFFRFSFRRE
ncbi:MAG: hypothetical protein KatS3mg015_2610 [Fimbriimonadales bacterium]|nr:MAG: hypothetical protein KatS3mg015_2610 [Fimbriimonadales bacterium]